MTRFARVSSSTGTNKRVPEDASSWSKLKPKHTQTFETRIDNEYDKDDDNQSYETVGEKNNNKDNQTNSKRSKNIQITWKNNGPHSNNEDTLIAYSKSKNKLNRQNKAQLNKEINSLSNTGNGVSCDNVPEGNNVSYKRKKPIIDDPPIYVDGIETHICRFEGFPVKKVDADRLKELKRKLVSMNVPRNEMFATLKAERRRAEKALARDRKKICFHCRHSGHILANCPRLSSEDNTVVSGICFKCGSTEHQHNECRVIRSDNYKCATCFICKEEGHISKQCPDNPRGLYPLGGSCKLCGNVTHLKKDCPQANGSTKKKDEFYLTAKILNNDTPDALDDDLKPCVLKPQIRKKKKIIKM